MNRKAVSGSTARTGQFRVPVTVRLPKSIVKQIDAELIQREIPLSRNNWLLEAAIEKLRKNGTGGPDGTQ